ncbi:MULTISPECIES: hypothetical protein [Cysteiniphilum]|uniref:Uncharacterized protein n=1 Tax=Cysteiniphilum litorale TaxID=2056700 RepID=A0A8J2Z7I8_9GAMM|nr:MULTISPECIES: hypothetical protein [Cysteiniphilum]GGG09246.1 hypothetical protein GCM10010995_28570 [Cysteiniphilum litorale]
MDKFKALQHLINFDLSLDELKALLSQTSWDETCGIELKKHHLNKILMLYKEGKIQYATLSEWANLLENREDISYQSNHEKIMEDTIYKLANPDLEGIVSDDEIDLFLLKN